MICRPGPVGDQVPAGACNRYDPAAQFTHPPGTIIISSLVSEYSIHKTFPGARLFQALVWLFPGSQSARNPAAINVAIRCLTAT